MCSSGSARGSRSWLTRPAKLPAFSSTSTRWDVGRYSSIRCFMHVCEYTAFVCLIKIPGTKNDQQQYIGLRLIDARFRCLFRLLYFVLLCFFVYNIFALCFFNLLFCAERLRELVACYDEVCCEPLSWALSSGAGSSDTVQGVACGGSKCIFP